MWFVGNPAPAPKPKGPVYRSSKGEIEIAKMATPHLDNAILKATRTKGFNPAVLTALKAEAGKRER